MSKGIYIGVDDKARKVTKAYIGVENIARKILKGYEGNENGIARQFYSAEKAHYWRRYNANYWEMQSMHTVGKGGDSYSDGEFPTQRDGTVLFASYSFDTYTGNFILSSAQNVSWVFESSDQFATWYDLAANCKNTYTSDPIWWSQTTSGIKRIYHIDDGSGVIGSGYGDGWVLSINAGYYAKPTAHATGYTLIKGSSAPVPPLTPSYPRLDDSGYSYYQDTDSGMDTYRSYDDYYWEYDGYHE